LRNWFEGAPYGAGKLSDYANQMRSWPGLISKKVNDHFCRWTPRDFKIFKNMKAGDKYPAAWAIAIKMWLQYKKKTGKNIAKDKFVPPYRLDNFPERWRKLDPNGLAWTLTAHLSKDTYTHIHYDSQQARTITIREAARLQSFPDGFRFSGNMGDAFKQIGNAVPPLLAFELGLAVRKQLAKLNLGKTKHRTSSRSHPEMGLG